MIEGSADSIPVAVGRILAKLMVLVAVLLMPLGMTTASAAGASDHDMAAMPMSHCPDGESRPEKAGIAACTMTCSAALPATEPAEPKRAAIDSPPMEIAKAKALVGLHPDAATPPPKQS